jgi:hypothetical protein
VKSTGLRDFIIRAVPWLLSLLVLSCSPRGADRDELNVDWHYRQGMEAYRRSDYATYLEHFRKAVKLSPTHPEMMFNLGRAYCLLGKRALALEWLGRAVERGLYLKSFPGDHLDSIKETAEYQSLVAQAAKRRIPVWSSGTAFSLSDDDFCPEGIAYDPVTRIFFVGSFAKRKIVTVDATGREGLFATEGQDGLAGITGMTVDARRRVLWVATSVPVGRSSPGDIPGWSAVFKYDLKTGTLVKKYSADSKTGPHLFNDLALTESGDVFVTDSLLGAIFLIRGDKEEGPELWIKPKHMTYPNGIALSDDNRRLYVAQGEGVSVISVETRSSSLLSVPDDLTLTGIDGLYYYKNSLVGVQYDYSRGRVIQFLLNEASLRVPEPRFLAWLKRGLFFLNTDRPGVKGVKILEAENPLFLNPQTGVIDQDTFYYIANCRISAFMGAKDLPPGGAPGVLILKTRLQ